MGDITQQKLRKRGRTDSETAFVRGLAEKADGLFFRKLGFAKCIDVPLDKMGDFWRASYDKVGALLPDSQEKKNADSARDRFQRMLNDWSSLPDRGYKDVIKNLGDSLEEVVEHLRKVQIPIRGQDAIDNFHNVGFSVFMALIAGYENAHSEIKDFQAMFNTLKLTSRCDSLYEKWGEPSVPFQMGPNESAAEYWRGKTLVANDVNEVLSISPDLAALENADPANQKSWALALQRLTENLDKVTSPFQADGKTPRQKEAYVGVAGMLFVEAARKALGISPRKGELGHVRSEALKDLNTVETLKRIADKWFERWKSSGRRPDEKEIL